MNAPRTAILAVVGPTGSGKTELAIALAERLAGEIVGCDALQVYRGFDAATAKPDADQRARIPHHLIDCLDPRGDCTMADYGRAADRAITEIAARGRLPIVAGGTGLYLRALLRGFLKSPRRDPALRERLYAIAERGGVHRLHRILSQRDAQAAGRIHPNDVQRLVRAVELALLPGPNLSERVRQSIDWEHSAERYRAFKIGLQVDPARLREKIDVRIDRFWEEGLIDEVQRLLADGVPPEANAFKAIGYREVLAALVAGEDPRGCLELIRRNTRRYARRQRSWFRGEAGVRWFDAERPTEQLCETIIEQLMAEDTGA
jgi:tRNA dimethylallyltransferase